MSTTGTIGIGGEGMEFWGRVRQKLVELNWTQKTLAKALGITPSALSRYARGEAVPRADTAVKMAAVLEVSLDWLLLGKVSPDSDAWKHRALKAEDALELYKSQQIVSDPLERDLKQLVDSLGLREIALLSNSGEHVLQNRVLIALSAASLRKGKVQPLEEEPFITLDELVGELDNLGCLATADDAKRALLLLRYQNLVERCDNSSEFSYRAKAALPLSEDSKQAAELQVVLANNVHETVETAKDAATILLTDVLHRKLEALQRYQSRRIRPVSGIDSSHSDSVDYQEEAVILTIQGEIPKALGGQLISELRSSVKDSVNRMVRLANEAERNDEFDTAGTRFVVSLGAALVD